MLKRMVVLIGMLCAMGALAGPAAVVADEIWTPPVNLSRSGAASDPLIVQGARGTLQAIWWDTFDGLTTSFYNAATDSWRDPTIAPIVMVNEEGESYWIVWDRKPTIVADGAGTVHAFWTERADPFRPEILRLRRSELQVGSASWSRPDIAASAVMAYAAAPQPGGGILLAYVRNEQTAQFPAGLYFRRPGAGGTAVLLYETRHFRGVAAADVYLHLSVADDGALYVAWDDPRLEQALYVVSRDGGGSWSAPQTLDDPDAPSRRLRFLPGPRGELLRIWEDGRAACALYQQLSTDGGETWSERTRILEDLRACPSEMRTLRASDGSVILAAGTGSGTLSLAAWDGERWSQLRSVSFSFEDPTTGRRVTLDKLRVELVEDRLAVVGLGSDGETWFTQGALEALSWAFAPPPPWSAPANVSQAQGPPAAPAVAMDAEGRVHVLWSELSADGVPGNALYYSRSEEAAATTADEVRWTRPVRVLGQAGLAHQPSVVVVGDRLHAVWSGGDNGQILYSRAYVRDAYIAGGWDAPQALSPANQVGSAPQIVADLLGGLHVVYAVPVNEGRGIYLVHSEDGGELWGPPETVFDAEAAGWVSVDRPALAVDAYGALHVAWVRAALAGRGSAQGIFYSRATPYAPGDTERDLAWSRPFEIAPGANDLPVLITTYSGQVHLIWQERSGAHAWFHRWLSDGYGEWSLRARLPGMEGVPGPLQLAVDGANAVHLAALGRDDVQQPALRYTVWQGDRWSPVELMRLPAGFEPAEGAALALQPLLGRLALVFRAGLRDAGAAALPELFAVSRAVTAVPALPEPAFAPPPTPTPTPGPTPLPTPTPRPTVNVDAPPESPPVLELGPVTLPFVALGGILGATVLVIGVATFAARRR